jgi:hypothetical protein
MNNLVSEVGVPGFVLAATGASKLDYERGMEINVVLRGHLPSQTLGGCRIHRMLIEDR